METANERDSAATPKGGRPVSDDEISLYDLWAVLVQRRWVLLGVALAVSAAGLIYALSKPPAYRYTTVLEVGRFPVGDPLDNDRAMRYLQPPEEVSLKLDEVHIPNAVQPQGEEQNTTPLRVENPPEGGLVLLHSEANESRAERIRATHRAVVDALLADHRELAAREEQRRQLMLDRARRGLQHLEDPRIRQSRIGPRERAVAEAEQALVTLDEDYRMRKLDLENEIQAKERELASLVEKRRHLEREEGRLETLGELLAQQIEEGKRLAGMLESTRSGAQEAVGRAPDEAFGLLLVTAQLERAARRLAGLRERSAVELPRETDRLAERLSENARRQSTVAEQFEVLNARLRHASAAYNSEKARLSRQLQAAETTLRETKATYERDVATARGVVDEARLAVDEVLHTEAVAVAKRSAHPVGAGSGLVGALSVILGLMLGVFAAFFAEFVSRAREYKTTSAVGAARSRNPELELSTARSEQAKISTACSSLTR